MKKKKAEEWEGLQFFLKVVREGLDEKMTFEQKDLQKRREWPISIVGGKESRQKKRQVQRPWGKSEPNKFKKHQGKQNGRSRAARRRLTGEGSGRERRRGPGWIGPRRSLKGLWLWLWDRSCEGFGQRMTRTDFCLIGTTLAAEGNNRQVGTRINGRRRPGRGHWCDLGWSNLHIFQLFIMKTFQHRAQLNLTVNICLLRILVMFWKKRQWDLPSLRGSMKHLGEAAADSWVFWPRTGTASPSAPSHETQSPFFRKGSYAI